MSPRADSRAVSQARDSGIWLKNLRLRWQAGCEATRCPGRAFMNRIPLSLAARVLATLSVPASPPSAAGQGARARGSAPVVGRAVPGPRVRARTAGHRARRRRAPPQAQRARHARRARSGRRTRACPRTRRIEVPSATAVPRSVPRVVTPGVVVPQVIQPRVDVRRQNDYPVYRPGYRPNMGRSTGQTIARTIIPATGRPTVRTTHSVRVCVWDSDCGWAIRSSTRITCTGYPSYPLYSYPYPVPVLSVTYSYPVDLLTPGTATLQLRRPSFDITPPQASVYIDGQYVGVVSQFSPDQPPLWLVPAGITSRSASLGSRWSPLTWTSRRAR